jgi:hypothetical protein
MTEDVHDSPLKDANDKLLLTLDSLKKKVNSSISNAAMISILQNSPCRYKCLNEITNSNWDKNWIDPFYFSRHEWVKMKIIDAILDKFAHLIDVKSEHRTTIGKLDIAVLGRKIELRYNRKIIAIEIKTGETVNSGLFNQIQRYLTGVDLLLIVRIPSNDVVPIDAAMIRDILVNEVNLLARKAESVLAGDITKVSGEWCKGCTAEDCEFRKKPISSKKRYASFEGYENFVRNVDEVIAKTIAVLQGEIIVG